MPTQNHFTFREWASLRLAPNFATAGVSVADSSGLLVGFREGWSGAFAIREASKAGHELELLPRRPTTKGSQAFPT